MKNGLFYIAVPNIMNFRMGRFKVHIAITLTRGISNTMYQKLA